MLADIVDSTDLGVLYKLFKRHLPSDIVQYYRVLKSKRKRPYI